MLFMCIWTSIVQNKTGFQSNDMNTVWVCVCVGGPTLHYTVYVDEIPAILRDMESMDILKSNLAMTSMLDFTHESAMDESNPIPMILSK